MHKRVMVVILMTLFLVTGCWDKIEIEERAQISAIGIDKYTDPLDEQSNKSTVGDLDRIRQDGSTKKDLLTFTFAFPKNSVEETEDIIISSVGDTLYGVSRVLANRTNKEIFLGHLRVVILNSDVVKDVNLFREVIDGMQTNELLSRRVIIAITDGSASDIINMKPTMQPRIGQFISELFRRKDRTPRAPEGFIEDILRGLHENENTVIPKITGGKTDVKLAGAGVIGKYQFKGWLGELETSDLMVLKGKNDIVGGMSAIYKGRSIPIDLRPQKPKISLIESGDNIKILIKIVSEADIKQTYFESSEDLLNAETIKDIENVFDQEMESRLESTVNKIQKEFETDVIGISEFLRKYHPDLWNEVRGNWEEIFPNIDIDVSFDVEIRRTGLVR